ncbi:MAG: hypothetical protein J3K34DRAFT_526907 [Monoraphidium minutum]|nr:MAG: hypothetical protein J3K34DRAFT_526907 [Monoraphidium minutum]
MNGLNGGAARPLLLHRHRMQAQHPRRGESWMPVLFGACLMLLVTTTWVATHRTISSLESAQPPGHVGEGWARRDGGPPGAAAAAAAPAPPGGGDGSGGGGGGGGGGHGPGPGDTTSVVTSGDALSRAFGALADKWGARGGAAAAAAAAAAGAGGAAGAPPGADAVALAGAALPDSERDIELHPDRVAAVVGRAKAAEVEQLLQLGGGAPGGGGGELRDLYGANAGGIFFGPLSGAANATCPKGGPTLRGAQVAAAVLAGAGSAARLERAVRALLRRWGRAPEGVRGQLHLFVAVDGSDPDVIKVATHFAVETMGVVRLVQRAPGPGEPPPLPAPAGCGGADAGRPAHVLFLLRLFLECFRYPSLLLLPDGAELAPDALQMFAGAAWLLASDPSLMCIAGGGAPGDAAAASADAGLLLRSDSSDGPPRGWMVGAAAGRRLLDGWRAATAGLPPGARPPGVADGGEGWAAYLRSAAVRGGRQCIVPELPRVRAAACGGGGASNSSGGGGVADGWFDDGEGDAAAPGGGDSSGGKGGGEVAAPGALPGGPGVTTVGGLLAQVGPEKGRRRRLAAAAGGGAEGAAAADSGKAPAAAAAAAEGSESAGAAKSGDAAAAPAAAGAALGAGAKASGARRRRGGVAWMEADLAWLMEPSYGKVFMQHLAGAKPVALASARALSARRRARRLRYGAAAEYRADMDMLGLPTATAQLPDGERYCFPVPAGPVGADGAVGATREHCQDFMPPLSYRGVVPAYSPAGARVFVTPAAYDAVLPSDPAPAPAPAGAGAGAAAAAAPAEAEPEVSDEMLDAYLDDPYGDLDAEGEAGFDEDEDEGGAIAGDDGYDDEDAVLDEYEATRARDEADSGGGGSSPGEAAAAAGA